MELNETYDQSKSQILMTEPTSGLNKTYSMMVERESQRSIVSSSMVGDNADVAALMTRKGDTYQYNKGQNHQYHKGRRNWEQ